MLDDLGKTIRARRKQRKLSQQEVSDYLGLSVNFIKAVEQGKVNIQLDKLLHLTNFFGIELQATDAKG